MIPIDFKESNSVLKGGPASDFGTSDDVLDLHTFRGSGEIISCWQLTWRERWSALFHGIVWLRVQSNITCPPVGLEAIKDIFTDAFK